MSRILNLEGRNLEIRLLEDCRLRIKASSLFLIKKYHFEKATFIDWAVFPEAQNTSRRFELISTSFE